MSHHSVNFKILCICILAFHACTHGSRQGADLEVGRIRLDFSELSDTLCFSAFVDSVEEKTLLLPDSLYLGESAQVYVDIANIFVTDWRQNRIYRFDGRGRFLNEIDRWGEGPEEYLRVSKVWTRDDVLYVYDNKGLKINTYTLEGDFIGMAYDISLSSLRMNIYHFKK